MRLNSMRRLSIAAGAVLLLVSLFLWQETMRFPAGKSGEPGPAIWPRILLLTTAVFAAYMIVEMLRTRTDRPVVETSLRLPVGLMGASILYLFLMNLVGYWVTTPIFLAGSMWMLRIRSWRLLVGVTAGFVALVYLIFASVLQIALPAGSLATSMGG